MIDAFGRQASSSTLPVRCHADHAEALRLDTLLCAMQAADPGLVEHGRRTAQYAVRLGRILDLPLSDLVHLHVAGLLHDLGQITLPPNLLQKEHALTADEYARVQSHPRAGAELLTGIDMLAVPAVWIAHHHERWDGSGYPYGLRGASIPLGARILAVADAYDSLTTRLPTRQSADKASGLHLLRVAAGFQLDPELVHRFAEVEERSHGFDLRLSGDRS